MKRIYVIATVITLTVIAITITLFFVYQEYSFDGEEKVYTIKTNYTYNVADDNKLEVIIYSNNPKSVIKEYKEILCTLKDKDEDMVMTGEIEEVKKISSYMYNDERFYSYKLYIVPAKVDFTFKITNCILQTRDLSVNIGNISVVKIKNSSTYPLDFTKIYAVGNDNLGFKSINAFVVTIKNKSNSDIVINDFYIGEYNSVDLTKAHVLTKDISNSEDITKYINYNAFDYKQDDGEVVIPKDSSVKLLIPVYYKNKAFLGNTLIYINDQLYIDNFSYIQSLESLDMYEGVLNEAEINFTK